MGSPVKVGAAEKRVRVALAHEAAAVIGQRSAAHRAPEARVVHEAALADAVHCALALDCDLALAHRAAHRSVFSDSRRRLLRRAL